MKLEEITRLREASGSVDINSRLISFLYQLMRDHVPPGTVEAIALDCNYQEVKYTNGWLARYAEDIAKRLSDTSLTPEKIPRPIPGPGKKVTSL